MNDVEVAKVAHEVNRAYCEALGDISQRVWNEAPEWQKDSAVDGVRFHKCNPDAGPSHSHDNWMEEKLSNGWVYGTMKDEEAKTHPSLIPYNDLPDSERAKDFIFRAVVHALCN